MPANNVKHRMTKTRLYSIWRGIKCRCTNPKHSDFPNYGGRGISMCDEWQSSFEAFKQWSELNGYSEFLSIDRIDNAKGYYPENCRWATPYEQTNNRDNTIFIQYQGVKHTLKEWSEILKIPYATLWYRLFRTKIPWSIEQAFENKEVRDLLEEEENAECD